MKTTCIFLIIQIQSSLRVEDLLINQHHKTMRKINKSQNVNIVKELVI